MNCTRLDEDEIRDGWTVSDVEQLAAVAARTHYASTLHVADRQETASYAICTAILEATAPLTDRELLGVGRDAISRATADEYHHHGRAARDLSHAAPSFVRYWYGTGGAASPWEDDLIEGIAVGQITGILAARYVRDLQALADHGTYAAAARALGTTDATFRVRIGQARAAFRAWWFEHEDPPGMWGSDRRAGSPRSRPVTHTIRARARDRARNDAIQLCDKDVA